MAKFTRGFTGRGTAERDPRLPPGQYDTGDQWPVLTAEATPKIDPATWTFTVEGHVEQPTTWTWDEIHALPPSAYNGDIHCVTTWSKFGMEFEGVSVDTLLAVARPAADASHVVAFSSTGYTTNLPLADVTGGKAWVVCEADGAPLPRDHGGPARLLVPHLYFWKSAKWVVGPARCSTTTSPASGSATATTTAATPGSNSATRATERPRCAPTACRGRRRRSSPIRRRDAARRRRSGSRLDEPTPPPRRSALRRAAHRTRRLHRVRAPTRSRRRPTTADELDLTVERLDDGEVSTFLHDVLEVGDELEVRGPIGGWFVWEATTPALLLGGGSGIVPLMAMLRLARAHRSRPISCDLVVSVRTPDDLYYADELPGPETHRGLHAAHAPPRWPRPAGRLTRRRVVPHLPRRPPSTCAARRRSPTPSATCSSTSASRPNASASNASAPAPSGGQLPSERERRRAVAAPRRPDDGARASDAPPVARATPARAHRRRRTATRRDADPVW